MRISTVIAAAVLCVTTSISAAVSPDELLQRGRDNYKTGHYEEAAKDLSAAGDALLTPEALQAYINSGNFSGLGKFETAMVYLALSDAKLGRDADARDAVHRLAAAERVQGVYASLPLEADAADFPAVAARVAPAMTLPSNTALAQLTTGTPSTQVAEATPPPAPAPAPTAVVAEAAPPAPAPAPEATSPAAPAPAPAAPTITQEPATIATPVDNTPKLAVQPTLPEQRAQTEAEIAEARAAAQRAADARVAQERAAAQRAANEQIASARAAAEKSAADQIAAAQRESEQRVAQERAAAEKSAAEKIAAAQRESEQRVAQERAAAEQAAAEKIAAAQRAAAEKIAAAQAAAQKETETRVAQEREAAQRRAEQQIADARAAAERETAQRIAAAEAAARQNLLASLRQAQAYAKSGKIEDANRIYLALLNGPNPSRELLAAAGTGLYRTGSFKNAADAFRRLGTFARGEEDLRYYNAVSLFETGQYDAAKKELACALPYIQVTTDVARYRAKIEEMAGQQAAR